MRKARVAFEKDLVENVSRIEICDAKERQLGQGAHTLFGCLPEPLLTLCVKGQGMHEVGAYEGPLEIIKCGSLSVFAHVGLYAMIWRQKVLFL